MKKIQKSIVISILFTSNNVVYSLTDFSGNVLFWTSTGSKKSRGVRKSTSMIVTSTSKTIADHSLKLGYSYAHIKIKGFGKNKKTAIKSLKLTSLNILSLCDQTSLPHNGCKKTRTRRI
nr:ribosomal protein S11 [Ahnfeltia plicata]